MNGFSVGCLFLMPMLGRTQHEYPRFRDCWLSEDKERIVIYTRVGGGNRNQGYGEEELYEDPNFVKTEDDEFDSTYATYEFRVPEEWKSDFDLILEHRFNEVSDAYVARVKKIFPKLDENGLIDSVFRESSPE